MRAPGFVRRWARLAVTLALGLGGWATPSPALAWGRDYGYGYGYGYEAWGWEAPPVYVQAGPPMLAIDDQYYELGTSGLRRLCDAHPDLCAAPVQERLDHLAARRAVGIALAWTGVGAAVVGPIISTAVNCAHTDYACQPNTGVVLGTVLGGLAMGITGIVLVPGNHDAMNVVNVINRSHPEHPIGLRLSLGPKMTPTVALAGHF